MACTVLGPHLPRAQDRRYCAAVFAFILTEQCWCRGKPGAGMGSGDFCPGSVPGVLWKYFVTAHGSRYLLPALPGRCPSRGMGQPQAGAEALGRALAALPRRRLQPVLVLLSGKTCCSLCFSP